MALVSGENWAAKLKYEQETGNPYVEPETYPTTKWDSSPVNGCPKCDCTATTQSVNAIITSLQKFSDYQEQVLGEIIDQLQSRISIESGGQSTLGRTSAVSGVASVYSEDKAVTDFWNGLQQIDRMFMSRSPQASDTQMLQSQLSNIDKFASQYTLDPTKVADWKQKLNKWIATSLQASGKTVHFAQNTSGFGSGS
jgi:hypothetical protein